MARRFSSEERRGQIVEAALHLLATVPIDQLTTRMVAKSVGVSQPALFRHFRSRDEILAAVVEHTRSALEELASPVLDAGTRSTAAAIELLLRGLFEYITSSPGVPRLLFYNATSVEAARYHAPLKHLIAMQKALIAELLRQGQARGEFASQLDPARAADLLVALIQGKLLQWLLASPRGLLNDDASTILEFWLAALRAGAPKAIAQKPSVPAASPDSGVREADEAIVELDVRPILEAGNDPLETILATLNTLAHDAVLKLTAPFQPRPLLALLAKRGYRVTCRQVESKHWQVEVLASGAPEIEDYRDLEAPEPLEKVLQRVEDLAPGTAFIARVPRTPNLLLPHLHDRGLRWQLFEEPEHSALIHIRRPT